MALIHFGIFLKRKKVGVGLSLLPRRELQRMQLRVLEIQNLMMKVDVS